MPPPPSPPQDPPAARTTPTLIWVRLNAQNCAFHRVLQHGCRSLDPLRMDPYQVRQVPLFPDSLTPQWLRGSLKEIGLTFDDSLHAPSPPSPLISSTPVLPWGMPVGYLLARPLFHEAVSSSAKSIISDLSLLSVFHLGSHTSFSHYLTCLGVKLTTRTSMLVIF